MSRKASPTPHPRGWGSVRPYGPHWRARIYIDGDRQSVILPTREKAETWLALKQEAKVRAKAGAEPVGSAPDVRVSDLAPELLEEYRAGTRRVYSARTIATYEAQLAQLVGRIGQRRVASLRPRDVEDLVKWQRSRKAATSTIRHLLDRLAQLVGLAVRRGYLAREPLRVERPRYTAKTATWRASEIEYRQLLAAAAADWDKRAELTIALAGDAGLRVSEIAQLRVGDVDLEGGHLRVEVRGESEDRTKSGARQVPILTARLRRLLREIAGDRAKGDRLLDVQGRDAVSGIALATWRDGLDREPAWHGLRRRFARWQADKGTPVHVIRAWLGHRLLTTTLLYIGLDPGEVPPQAYEGRRVAHGSQHRGRVGSRRAK
jgi:integrase